MERSREQPSRAGLPVPRRAVRTAYRFAIGMIFGALLTACSSSGHSLHASDRLVAGQAQVARLPHGDGLQFCVSVRARDLAPSGSSHVYIHSISSFITTTNDTTPALLAITGRYPGWDTPGTTIYNQPFTNSNSVWLEIIHEFPLGMACIEVYGHGLGPSRYGTFNHRILLSYTYAPAYGPGTTSQKLFPIHWGPYLHRYSPRHRPKH